MFTLRHAVTAATLVVLAQPAAAQTREPRVTVSAVAQQEVVDVDGGSGAFTAAGAGLSVRLVRFISVFGELTGAGGELNDAYEGIFVSIAPPGASREEIERLGVVLQRARTWRPGLGGAFGVAFHSPRSQPLGVELQVGLAGRSLELTDTKRLVRLPEGWDPSRSTGEGTEVSTRSRGGIMAGVSVPVRIGSRVTIAPDLRFAFTLADEDYTAWTLGARGSCRF